ncbi:MAG TPA: hypothetical protein VGH89_36805 [Pseudonocardia sp.]
MIVVFALLVLAFVVLRSAHQMVPALFCLVMALMMVPPVRVLIKFCLAGVIALIVAGMNELFQLFKESDRLDRPPALGPGWVARPAPAQPPTWRGQAHPTQRRWQGQARPTPPEPDGHTGPFL